MPDPIPKFLSFKPKHKRQEESTKEPISHAEHRRDESYSKHSHSDRKRAHERVESESHSRHRSSHNRLREKDYRQHDVERPASSTYTIDKVGDRNNVRYGSLHKYDIPQYHRLGYGTVLGLEHHLRIDRNESSHAHIVLEARQRREDDHSHSLARARSILKAPAKLLGSQADGPPFPLHDQFVALSRSRKRKRGSRSPIESERAYRELDGGRHYSSTSDSEASDNEAAVDPLSSAQRKNGQLSRQVRERPADSAAWKVLIDHQAAVIAPNIDATSLTTTQRRAVADVRLHLYQKALEAVAGADRRELVSAMLEEGSHMWDADTCTKRYQEAILQDPSHVDLWRRYLDLLQNPSHDADVEVVKQRFVECSALLQTARQAEQDPQTANDLGIAQIYVILRLTRLLHDLGFEEMSIAIWQMLMDTHALSQDQADVDRRRAAFASAWDDEVPRFGEGETTTAEVKDVDSHDRGSPSYARWAEIEQSLSTSREMPGKTTDDPDDSALDDVLHVVFFADLEDIMSTTKLALDWDALVDAFLAFFGLPPVPTMADVRRPWHGDPALLVSAFKLDDQDGTEATWATLLALFASTYESIWLEKAFPPTLAERTPALAFLDRALGQLVVAQRSPTALSMYWLAFQATYFPTVAAKTAKKLLKATPSDLCLYHAAAQVECCLGRYEKAATIFGAAIQAGSTSSPPDALSPASRKHKVDVIRLAHSWAWMKMHLNNQDLALTRLSSYRGQTTESLSSATLLALHDDFKAGLQISLNSGDIQSASLYASAHLLLTYLTSPSPLPAVLALHNTHTALSRAEAIHQTLPPLVELHISHHHPHRPLAILSTLSSSLALHGSNTLLLSLHARLSAGRAVIDPIPAAHLSLDAQSSAHAWLAALEQAMRRPTKEPARSLFRRATKEGSVCARCPAIWRAWLSFETEIPRRKSVWHAGRAAMPWSKGWILAGMRMLDIPGGVSQNDLRGVYDGMLDRGMRIRRERE